MKILVNDGMEAEALEKLKALGYDVDDNQYKGEDLVNKIKEVDVIVVRSATKVRKDLIDEALKIGKLKLIIRGGVGVDNIDVKYAEENGITVRNTPLASSASVAELAIGHMFALARYINISNVTMREGKWEKKKYQGFELGGKTLGLIGFGRIARETAKRASALGMKVVYTDITGEAKGYDQFKFLEKEELLKVSDFVSLHIPFIKSVGAVIGEKELNIMKNSAYLINCARGGVVDEKALLNALNNGDIAGAALDVFEKEPNENAELVNHPKVSATPHIGGSTIEAQKRIGEEIVAIINEFGGKDLDGDDKAV